jgi:hypothetical protein
LDCEFRSKRPFFRNLLGYSERHFSPLQCLRRQISDGPYQNQNNTAQFTDSVSWNKGKHSFKFGHEYDRQNFNQLGSAGADHGLGIGRIRERVGAAAVQSAGGSVSMPFQSPVGDTPRAVSA